MLENFVIFYWLSISSYNWLVEPFKSCREKVGTMLKPLRSFAPLSERHYYSCSKLSNDMQNRG